MMEAMRANLAHLPEAVGVEQHAAQGVAAEDGLDQAGQLGVAGLAIEVADGWE
jgi:hypothetical protein